MRRRKPVTAHLNEYAGGMVSFRYEFVQEVS